MDSGQLAALCFALLFCFLLLPWMFALRYKWDRTPKKSRSSQHVAKNANNYRRFEEYTVLIVCYAIIIAVYIIVIDRAANDSSFLGKRGSRKRSLNFQVLSFIRTGFAVVHLPILTAVLAATVPYWTMAKADRPTPETTALQGSKDASEHAEQSVDQRTRVTQLFYLADRTWAGLVGWITTFIYGWNERAFSYIWVQLAIIAALAYAGFPLLSLAYVTRNTQYWDSSRIPGTGYLGGQSQSQDEILGSLQNRMSWMRDQPLLNSSLHPNLIGFNSSSQASYKNVSEPFEGLGNQSYYFPWADNQTFTTLVYPEMIDKVSNIQLPLAGIRAFASCAINTYAVTELIQKISETEGSTVGLNLRINTTASGSDSNLPYTLSCAQNCSKVDAQSAVACHQQSSMVNITSFDMKSIIGSVANSVNGGEVETTPVSNHYTFSNVGSTAQGQALSCVQQAYTDGSGDSMADILLAVQDANNMTQLAECGLHLIYMKPTVNTLIGQYIDSTALDTPVFSGASPVELLNLSMTSYLNFFHEGPPIFTEKAVASSSKPDCTIPPISNGFQWVSDWALPCDSNELPKPVTNQTDPASLLQQPYSDYIVGATNFDERVFLGPLASFMNDPQFFPPGNVSGVTFKVENGLAYGKVPPVLAVIVLAIPILWTIALSVITATRRRWTASLDAFAMFKLGAGWRDDLEDLGLTSLGKSNGRLSSIPGTVVVVPETGKVELSNVPPRRRLSKRSRRPTWLQQRGFP